MAKDLSQMTDDELYAHFSAMPEIEYGKLILAPALAGAKAQASAPPPEDNSMGMSGPELAAAGFAQRFMGIPRGFREMAIGLKGSPEEIEAYNQEKAEQQRLDKKLLSNWEANVGGLGWDAATSTLVAPKLGVQALAAGTGAAVRPTAGDIQGVEIPERLTNAGVGAGTTAVVGQGVRSAGKVLGATKGEFTADGKEAMRQNEAARRLGVDRSVGDLSPTSPLHGFERALPGYPEKVADQAQAFTRAAQEVKDIPSKTGRSFEPRLLEGEKIRQSIVEGGDKLIGEGSKLWKSLDNYVVQNGLPQVRATSTEPHVVKLISQYTPVTKKGPQLQKNPVLQRIDEYDPEAAKALLATGTPKSTLPFDDLHRIQSAVGKALQRAEKDASAPGASMEDRKVRTELRALYSNLAKDVDSWSAKDPKAQALLSDAKSFWRDRVVPSTINNRVYQKASHGIYGSNPRGYAGPEALYTDIGRHSQQLQDLYPYMPQVGRDLTDTFRSLPDVAGMLTSGRPHPPPSALSPLTTAAGMLAGSPFQLVRGALSHLPGARPIMESTPSKRLFFARNMFEDSKTAPAGPLGKAAWAAAQAPQQELESGSRKLLGLKPRP